MAKYKIGFIPKCEPYQLEDEYTVELIMKPLGGLPFSNIVFTSPDIRDCINKKKELDKAKRRR